MKGRVIADWTKVDFESRASRAKVVGALQHFMQAPQQNKTLRGAFQAFATKGDFPAEVLSILEKFHAVPIYDLGYEDIFDIRPFQNTKASGFKILSVESGLTFAKVKSGEKAKIFKMSGASVDVTFDLYGGGLGWDRVLIDDAQYWTLEDNAIAFRNQAYYSRAANFYALIEAVTGKDVAWQNPLPSTLSNTNDLYTANRDAQTINYACNAILTALKDKGMGVTPQSQFIILAPVGLNSRIPAALALMQQAVAGSPKKVNFNIRVIYTMMLSSSSYYYVILPKQKMKGGYRMDLTIYDKFDEMSYSDIMVGWQRYGGAIGETNQVRKCALS